MEEIKNNQSVNIFSELGFDQYGPIYACKYVPYGDPWGYNELQLNYVLHCVVVAGDYGKALRVDIKGCGSQFIPVSTQSNLQIGDVVLPKDVRFIKLIKADEPDLSKRVITRVL